MRTIERDDYGPAAQALIARAVAESRPRTLTFSAPGTAAQPDLQALTDQTISKHRRARMPHDAQALHAALWLLFDFMTESHDISQQIATPSGSYWHGILHRREPDAFNAKYWMARVGEHPVFPELLNDAREIAANVPALAAELAGKKTWDAAWFVDRCCGAHESDAVRDALLEIQRREWTLLFDHNFRKAFA
jgi:hypothetical protein